MKTFAKKRKKFHSDNIFDIFNVIFLGLLAVTCVLPFINVLSVSMSSAAAAAAGDVTFWPIGFNLDSYVHALSKVRFLVSMRTSVIRVILGLAVNISLVVLTAYPLSKSKAVLRGRTAFSWFFVVTMLIGGGLIPTFLIVKMTGIMDTMWALILPGAVPVFNVVILLNFFRQIPKEYEESSIIDGAGQWTTLLRIFVPLSKACLATLVLFTAVGHWNEWFSGQIYLNRIEDYPLATYLRAAMARPNFDSSNFAEIQRFSQVTSRTLSNAQIMIGALPIIAIYPFLQRFFVKGMMLGGLKG